MFTSALQGDLTVGKKGVGFNGVNEAAEAGAEDDDDSRGCPASCRQEPGGLLSFLSVCIHRCHRPGSIRLQGMKGLSQSHQGMAGQVVLHRFDIRVKNLAAARLFFQTRKLRRYLRWLADGLADRVAERHF